jgi:hypothetical protein
VVFRRLDDGVPISLGRTTDENSEPKRFDFSGEYTKLGCWESGWISCFELLFQESLIIMLFLSGDELGFEPLFYLNLLCIEFFASNLPCFPISS